MAVTVYRTWAANEVLTAADLNASFLLFSVNGQDVGDPRTKAANMAGFALNLDADGDTSMRASTDDQIDVAIDGTDRFRIDATGVYFDGVRLGSSLAVSLQVDMRTESLKLSLGALANQLTIGSEFFSSGGM